METFEKAFIEQHAALDQVIEKGLALQQFRSRHAEDEWSPEIGTELQQLLEGVTAAAETLSVRTRRVSSMHREKLSGC